jgi:pimeloyl-ACP methyl ester carboxylesterase
MMSQSAMAQRFTIFIPGYYGSHLIDRTNGNRIWPDAKEIVFGKQTLALDIPGLKIPKALELEAHEIVEKVPVFKPFFSISAYEPTMKMIRSLGRTEVHTIAFDWRKDPLRAVHLLDQKVKQLKAQDPEAQIDLVSHSFGSVVAAYYLRYGTQEYLTAQENWQGLKEFRKIVFSAAPFLGTMALFRNIFKGLSRGFNAQLLSPLAFSTFESTPFLLPPPHRELILDENLKNIDLHLWEPSTWWNNRWGLFQEKLGFTEESYQARQDYVSYYCKRARQFLELTNAPLQTQPTAKPLLYLRGTGKDTVDKGIWVKSASQPNIFLFYESDFKKWKPKFHEKMVYGDGDQTVPAYSSVLPRAWNSLKPEVIETNFEHLEVLQNKTSLLRIQKFLST